MKLFPVVESIDQLSADLRHARIGFIDGLRAFAIFFVAIFHAYARWPEIIPYASSVLEFPLFTYGRYGVQLFFLISGFVIFATLGRADSLWGFLFKRWIRLFPAMLICSGLIFVTAGFFPERPAGGVRWLDLLPGLTFVAPEVWQYLLGSDVSSLEGSFWSLYVEVKFYLFTGVLYLAYGRVVAAWAVLAAFILYCLCGVLVALWPQSELAALFLMLLRAMSLQYFGWFAAGAGAYLYLVSSAPGWLVLCLASILSCLGYELRGGLGPFTAALLTFSVFFAPLFMKAFRVILEARALQLVALASYPFYLLHENLMVACIVKLRDLDLGVPLVMVPLFPALLILCLSYFIATTLESRVRQTIIRFWIAGRRAYGSCKG